MVRRTASAKDEPEQSDFEKPSEKEHLFQVADIFDQQNHPEKMQIDDPNTVLVKAEVVGGDEKGRSILIQCTLDDSVPKFYYTRMFLKAISCQYKGDSFPIDSDEWQARQFYATVEHNKGKNDKTYANIKEYNFDKMVEQVDNKPSSTPSTEEEVAWDE